MNLKPLLLLVFAPLLIAQTGSIKTSVPQDDHSASTETLPARKGLLSARPTTCTQGAFYFATDVTAGQNIYLCTATDTWTQVTGCTVAGVVGAVAYYTGTGPCPSPSAITTTAASPGTAGYAALSVGTASGDSMTGLSGWQAPSSGGGFVWTLPGTDAAGAFVSDGSHGVSLVPFSGTGNIAKVTGATVSGMTCTSGCTGFASGSGTTVNFGAYSAKTCPNPADTLYYPTDWGTQYICKNGVETAFRSGYGQVTPPNALPGVQTNGVTGTPGDGYTFVAASQSGIRSNQLFGTTVSNVDVGFNLISSGVDSICGPSLAKDLSGGFDYNNMVVAGIHWPQVADGNLTWRIRGIVAGVGNNVSTGDVSTIGLNFFRLRVGSGNYYFEASGDGANWKTLGSAATSDSNFPSGNLYPGFSCDGGGTGTVFHAKTY